MTNEFGLDVDYFKKNFKALVRDCENYTPQEMRIALGKLARVAQPPTPVKRRCYQCKLQIKTHHKWHIVNDRIQHRVCDNPESYE